MFYCYFLFHSDYVVPGVLGHYQTALRDPAFFMLWKRIMNMFDKFHQHLPLYKREELECTSVTINNVEVDKLQTYFEEKPINITDYLYFKKGKIYILFTHTLHSLDFDTIVSNN